MVAFVKGGGFGDNFGVNEYLRSTNPKPRFESRTVAKDTVPFVDLRVSKQQKILQRGVVMAHITDGPNAGKTGPFQAAGTVEQQTLTKSGTWTGTGGTYNLKATGGTVSVDVPVGDSAADVAALVQTLPEYANYTVTATGGPLGTSPIVFSFTGDTGDDVPNLVFDATDVTGGTTPGAAVTQSQASSPGATDGRGVLTNIVGINETFLPWQLLEYDCEISVAYDSVMAVQAWCFELNAAGVFVPLSNTTADAMRGNKKLNIHFE